ncbi:unnamed protein product [Zymoseptoria tritici ST99CH_1E4]|uniref:Major facilitator superfamily (MFS) profile domain-containing protein n=1 Tax=Zymoseptoria tritici ST99CH_1E4 TaxID=1276532 RepID=A0A2H1G6R0_ZYMTR|nr:unnamed protein product [Zymoseptoria tritici ST99CH_1E4]
MATTTTTLTETASPEQTTADHRVTEQVSPSPFSTLEVDATQQNEPEYPTGTKLWLQILALCTVLILGGLDANIVATAVLSITDHFHTVADVGRYSSAFRLCSCAFQFAFAKMYTLFPSKRVFLGSNVIALIGSLLCATAASSRMFVAGRAVTGVGFAGLLSGVFAVLNEVLPRQKRPVFAGSLACVESVAIIAAPIVGGALTQSSGWRWCFWINLPIGAVSLTSIFFLFSDSPAAPRGHLSLRQKLQELDLISNCVFIPSLTALFLALSWAGTKYSWSDVKVIVLFVVFAVLMAAFLFNQHRRGDAAVLPFRILKNRSVVAGFYTTFTNSTTNVLEYYLPTYYQVVRSKTPSESGYLMVPILLGMMLGLFIHGVGTSTFGYYKPFMILGSIFMPIGAGLIVDAAVQTTLNPADVNLGTRVILFGQSIGPAVFIAVAHVILTNQLLSNLQDVVPDLSPAFLENNGLGNLKSGIPEQRWNDVFHAINESLTSTWFLTVALGGATLVGALLVQHRSVKQKRTSANSIRTQRRRLFCAP